MNSIHRAVGGVAALFFCVGSMAWAEDGSVQVGDVIIIEQWTGKESSDILEGGRVEAMETDKPIATGKDYGNANEEYISGKITLAVDAAPCDGNAATFKTIPVNLSRYTFKSAQKDDFLGGLFEAIKNPSNDPDVLEKRAQDAEKAGKSGFAACFQQMAKGIADGKESEKKQEVVDRLWDAEVDEEFMQEIEKLEAAGDRPNVKMLMERALSKLNNVESATKRPQVTRAIIQKLGYGTGTVLVWGGYGTGINYTCNYKRRLWIKDDDVSVGYVLKDGSMMSHKSIYTCQAEVTARQKTREEINNSAAALRGFDRAARPPLAGGDASRRAGMQKACVKCRERFGAIEPEDLE